MIPGCCDRADCAYCHDVLRLPQRHGGDLTEILVRPQGQKIGNVAPGVLFYYSLVTVPRGHPYDQRDADDVAQLHAVRSPAGSGDPLRARAAPKVQSNATPARSRSRTSTPDDVHRRDQVRPGAPSSARLSLAGHGQVTYTFTDEVHGTSWPQAPTALVLKQKPKNSRLPDRQQDETSTGGGPGDRAPHQLRSVRRQEPCAHSRTADTRSCRRRAGTEQEVQR